MTIIFFTCYVSFNSFFSLSVNGSTSLKAIMHQITESVSEFIYFAMMRKNICSQNETSRANYFQILKLNSHLPIRDKFIQTLSSL